MSFSNPGRNSHLSASVMVLPHSTGGTGCLGEGGAAGFGGGGGNHRTASSGGKHHHGANRSSGTVKGPDLRIFVRDVSDKQGKKRPLTVRTWSTVKDVKDVLRQHLGVPPSSQRLYFGPLMTSGGELPNHRTLHDAGIYRSGETLLLEVKKSAGSNTGGGSTAGASALASISSLNALGANDVCVSSSFLDVTPRGLRRTICQARRGFAVGLKPDLVLDGSGGTYFLHDAHKAKVAVFKPADEEPYAANNPRGYVASTAQVDAGSGFGLNGGLDDGMRAGISPGEACIREVAAYLLDHGGFSGVPATTLAEARHPAFNSNGARLKLSEGGAAIGSHSLTLSSPNNIDGGGVHVSPGHHSAILEKKVGSFQDFVHADYTMDDLSPSKLSVDEVHKIAILDIRILNADRNSANLLCRRKPEDPDNFELIPIDHGYCLRTVCDVCWFDWCWLDWPQLKKPLSRKSRDYVLGLDIEADVRMLRERLHLKGEAIDYFRASSRLLQAGVKAGLSLYDIAVLCCRNDDAGEVPSKLEGLTAMANELATSAIANGRWHHSAAAASLAEQLASANKAAPLSSSPSTSFSINTSGGAESNNKPSPKTLQFMFKSASSANFSSFVGDKKKKDDSSPRLKSRSLDDDIEQDESAPPPAVVQSSGSDSSSDVELEHEEEEECEEWAAAVIADVSICDKDASSLLRLKQRSTSVGSESDSSIASANHSASSRSSNLLSTSPVGFWYVRPGSEDEDDDQSHDVTWSPHLSPRASVVGLSSMALPAGVLAENLIPPLKEIAERRKSAVTFDVSPVMLPSAAPEVDDDGLPIEPLTEMSLGEHASSNGSSGRMMKPSDSSKSLLSRIPSKSAGLTRSLSYSAFSSRSSVGSGAGAAMPTGAAARNLQKMTSLAGDDDEQHHIYYLKFVALLIEGSITTVLRQREPSPKKDKESNEAKSTPTKTKNDDLVSFSAWD